MLFYEREGLCHNQYMPNVFGRVPVDVKDLDQDFDSDLKKVCTMMWSLSLYISYKSMKKIYCNIFTQASFVTFIIIFIKVMKCHNND